MPNKDAKERGELRTVRWRDSKMYLTQYNKEDDFRVSVIYSTGFVISEDKKQLVLAGDVVDEGDIRRVIVIPKENIF